MNYLFTAALLAISVYVLWSAVTAKGKLFATENIMEEKVPQFRKLLRAIYLGLGVVMLIMALISGLQQGLYAGSNMAGRFTEDFRTYYADSIAADGTIKGTDVSVDGVYRADKINSVFSSLPQPTIPDGAPTPTFAEAALDENGEPLYMLASESTPNENETYAKWRTTFPYRTLHILTYVFMGIALVVIVGLFVLINKFTDKEKAAKAKATRTGTAMPSSAFDFDESDEQNNA